MVRQQTMEVEVHMLLLFESLALEPSTGLPSVSQERFIIRKIDKPEEYHECEEVQRRAWGMPDIHIVPSHLLITAQKNGGLVLGAFDAEGKMVGYLFGFLGTTQPDPEGQSAAGRLKHCSHMVGILPECQSQGLGYLLKLSQRDHALSQGLDLVTWTFDPLESANANLNLSKLGVVFNTYLRDVYGRMTDELNAGLATDRVQVDWWIRSRRVVERLEKSGKKLSLDEMLQRGASQVNAATIGTDGVLRPSGSDLSSGAEAIVVEVPADFQGTKAADMSSAIDWRTHTRDLFCHYFEAGYAAVEFISEIVGGHRHSYYVLRRDFVIS
jgi:predicted GNAT superfamily acetyltransferase